MDGSITERHADSEQFSGHNETSRPEKRTFSLKESRQETPDIKTFEFYPEDGKEMFSFKPGHFVNISLMNDQPLGRRSFSIASSPNEKKLMLTIKKVGSFTNRIFDSPNGEKFEILGPLGLPYIRNESEECDYVLIAGGSGIVPFRSLLKYAEETGFKRKIWLFYSNKTKQDICYKDEFESIAKKTGSIRIINTLTREQPEGWEGELGRVNSEMLKKHIGSTENKKFILCGPPGLITGTVEILKELNIPMASIKTESWGN